MLIMAVFITYGGISEIGDRRKSNQDSILYVHGKVHGHFVGLFAVADGIGGLSYGQEISSYIISELKHWWKVDVPQMIEAGNTGDSEVQELLEQEIWDINQAVLKFNRQTGKQSGSTLSLLFLIDRKYYIKNLGDSRIYRMRGQAFEQLTVDQTTVRRMERNGQLRTKSVLTMCIGIPEVPVTCSQSGTIQQEDRYLLCSDGLYNCLEEGRILSILQDAAMNPEEMAACMRENIPRGMALDNVSAVIVRIEEKNWLRN